MDTWSQESGVTLNLTRSTIWLVCHDMDQYCRMVSLFKYIKQVKYLKLWSSCF